MTQIGIPLLSVPAMSVCTRIEDDVPMGVQLVAGRYREDILFTAAADIEARGELITVANPENNQ